MAAPHQLKKSLTLLPAIGLGLTMVVGSGLLSLPGLAYQQVGGAAVYAWLICALAISPILIIFSQLGARVPNAGGIAGFVQVAFSRRVGLATEILILGTLPGGAAIAITGGQYLAAMLNGDPQLAALGSLGILALGMIINYLGASLSGSIQQVLSFTLVGLLAAVAIITLIFGDRTVGAGIAPLSAWSSSLPAVGPVFFAFVGWELMSFTSEEFRNPKRDFPLMVAASFLVVLFLYSVIAIAIQFVLPLHDARLTQAPIVAMFSLVAGPASAKWIAFTGFIIVLTNMISVIWAFSRLVFASAREGLLPSSLGLLAGPAKVPRPAIFAVSLVFAIFMLAYWSKWISHSRLFELAGVSFFFAYILAVLAFLKIVRTWYTWFIGLSALLVNLVLLVGFGAQLLYPLLIFSLGLVISYLRMKRTG